MAMSDEDKETFRQARPYVVGIVAFAGALRAGTPVVISEAFDQAELFIAEFEKRNEI